MIPEEVQETLPGIADLVGIPHRFVIGEKGLANNQYEYKRRDGDKAEMIEASVAAVLAKLAS